MIPVRSILAATDLSSDGDLVIRSAAHLARAFRARLHVAHVAAPWDSADDAHLLSRLTAQITRALAGERDAEARTTSDVAGTTVTSVRLTLKEDTPRGDGSRGGGSGDAIGEALDVEAAVVYDRPFHGILVHAATVGADLIVLGPHRGTMTTARWSGTTAERVVRSADVPCLVVNREVRLPIRHAGVTVDFTPSTRGGALLAADWMPVLSAGAGSQDDPETPVVPRVSLIHVAGPSHDDPNARLTAEADRLRAGSLGSDVQGDGADLRVDAVLLEGADISADVARWSKETGADLLIVPTEARRGLRRMWSGSQATSLTMLAPCPVLLVPPALWRRSPIPLTRVAAALPPSAKDGAPRSWIERRVETAQRPLHLVHLDPALEAPEATGTPGLVRQARDVQADLLVIHESRTAAHEPIAPDVQAVLEHTPIPVLVLRDLPEGDIRRILVAVSTGDIWYEKFGWAKLLADRFDAHVTVFHAIDLSPTSRVRREPGGELVSALSVWMRDDVENTVVPAMRTWMWERVRLAGLSPDRVDVVLSMQDPWYAIPAMARTTGADLVIVAAHAEGRPGRVPLSPVAQATLKGGTYSTLVVVDRAKLEAERAESTRLTPRLKDADPFA